jgi:lipopolysaccharide cholinephosphotransferase
MEARGSNGLHAAQTGPEDFDRIFPDNRGEGATPLRQAQLVMLRTLRVLDAICRAQGIRYWLCSGTLLGAVRHKGFIPWDDDLDVAMLREDYERFLQVAPALLPSDLFQQTAATEPCYDNLATPCKLRDTKSLIMQPHEAAKHYHKGIFIDIFPFDRYHRRGVMRWRDRLLKSVNRFLCRCYDAEVEKHISLPKRIVALFRPLFRCLLLAYRRLLRPVMCKNNRMDDKDCYMGHGFDTPWIRYLLPSDIFPLQEGEFEGFSFSIPHNPDRYLRHVYGDYMKLPPESERKQQHFSVLKPILDEI